MQIKWGSLFGTCRFLVNRPLAPSLATFGLNLRNAAPCLKVDLNIYKSYKHNKYCIVYTVLDRFNAMIVLTPHSI